MGGAFGALLGGKLITYGRRLVLILFIFISAISILPTLYLNIYTICLGRILLGISGGVMATGGMRML